MRAALGSEVGRNGRSRKGRSSAMHGQLVYRKWDARDAPLDLSSCVHPLSSSTTSSGSILVRSHASLHCGLTGAACPFARASASFFDLALLFREKNGIPVKQVLSSANVAVTLDHMNTAVLGRWLRNELRWSKINRPYVNKKGAGDP